MNSIFVWECPNLTMVGCFSSLQHQRVITNGATDSYTALYGGYLNFSTPIVAIFVLRKFHYD